MFTAKYKGTCTACNQAISVGDPISWLRRKPGQRGPVATYHAACAPQGKTTASVRVQRHNAHRKDGCNWTKLTVTTSNGGVAHVSICPTCATLHIDSRTALRVYFGNVEAKSS